MSSPTRRDVLVGTLAGVAATAAVLATPSILVSPAFAADAPPTGPLKLPPLPYPDTALAPVVSQNTLSFHHGKHHKAYVDNGNKALANSPLAARPVTEIIKATYNKPDQTAIYNNVAQAWNHDFYWQSMRPGGGGAPKGRIAEKLQSDLGGYDAFREAFTKAATGRFGSGWAWLVSQNGKLAVVDTGNADTPLTAGQTPLLVIDVWEHAYYLDWQNKRADYVGAWLDKLVNWEFAEKNLG
ncbi:MAG: superoxide dismutase [Myxococcota bacterium]